MGAGMAGGYSLWRSTRWLRRGLRRGVRIVSFGLFAAGAVAAAVETIKTIKNSRDRKKENGGEAESPEELRELTAETELLEREVETLRRGKTGHREKTTKTSGRKMK